MYQLVSKDFQLYNNNQKDFTKYYLTYVVLTLMIGVPVTPLSFQTYWTSVTEDRWKFILRHAGWSVHTLFAFYL